MKPSVAFVILTWNSDAYIADCLRSVFALSTIEAYIYVTNNGSEDQTGKILDEFAKQYPEKMEITNFSKNMGTTIPRNQAMKKAQDKADWICVLDSDTVINDSAMLQLIEAMEQNSRAMSAIPRMWDADNIEQLSCKKFPSITGKLQKAMPVKNIQEKGERKESYPFFPDENRTGKPPVSADKHTYPVDYGISACWLLRSSILEKVGYMDEKYFYAPEDVDYCVRIWKAGFQILFVSGSSIYHITQRLSHKKIFSKINVSHIRGLIRFFHQHHKYLRLHRKEVEG